MSDSKGKPTEAGCEGTVPKAVVSRLSLYLRELQHLVRDGFDTTSSTQLGKLLGFTDVQVRKDLAYFGQFGHPGIGYRCEELIHEIKRILGTDRDWAVALVGVGNLGRALLGYKGFEQQGFRVVAAFDVDPSKVGRTLESVKVYHLEKLPDIIQQQAIRLAIVAVPAAAAQSVAEQLVAAGVDGIMNFAPVTISLPKNVRKVGVDLAIELEQLTFSLVNRIESS
jgi:redox-sensing transcriptional repressor